MTMPDLPSFGSLDAPSNEPAPGAETPFRIAILGDFRGRGDRDPGSIAGRKPLEVAPAALDEALEKLEVRLELTLANGSTVELAFRSLDELHPDEIHDRVGAFEDADDDEEKTELMRQILHHAEFQALESAWRGVEWLLRRIHKKDGDVRVVLYDISFSELAADLTSKENLAQTALYRVLIEEGVGGSKGAPWAALVGLYAFEPNSDHAALLGRLARIAGHAGAPFLPGPSADVLNPDFTLDGDATAAWQALRQLPEAARLGVVAPRFLLRPPFGENTKSIDRFRFEEFSAEDGNAGYLWG